MPTPIRLTLTDGPDDNRHPDEPAQSYALCSFSVFWVIRPPPTGTAAPHTLRVAVFRVRRPEDRTAHAGPSTADANV